ncbi:MAG: hypothetical protein P1Q69_09375, partial [Candidatus Thorarchaeota archaeon]|nr:hypothetical protein [Candidatus Thorarchaeota archaeon]
YIIMEDTGTDTSMVIPGTNLKVQAGSLTTTTVTTGGFTPSTTVSFYPNFASSIAVFATRVTHSDSQFAYTAMSKYNSRTDPAVGTDGGMYIGFCRGGVTGGNFGTAETLDYIIVETGSGTITGGSLFQIVQSTDSVAGVKNDINGYSFGTLSGFTSPSVGVGTQLEMDGSDGGWAFGEELLSTQLDGWDLEDQDSDAERSHTGETCASWVFEQAGSFAPSNYRLDMEYQWTNVDYSHTSSELKIFVDSLSGESLDVERWAGSDWVLLDTISASSWMTIPVVLTQSVYTIRFIDTSQDADGTQDTWTIDAMFLHCWTDNLGFSVENDIDDNTSNIDGVQDIGLENDFSFAQGTTSDSQNMVLQEENTAGPVITQDFRIQRGYSVMASGSATLTLNAGTDYQIPTGPAFIRIVNTRLTGMGKTSGGGTQNLDDFTVYISSVNFGTSITFTRHGTANDNRISWEIVEYIGGAGGDNEIVVHDVGYASYGSGDTVMDTSQIAGISDDNDIVVYITGQATSKTDASYAGQTLSTAQWIGGGTDVARFTRGQSGNTGEVSYAVVEFKGANWNVQRIEHLYGSTNAEYETITDVSDISRAFIVHQHRITDTGDHGLDELGGQVYLSSSAQVCFDAESSLVANTQYAVVWIVSNTDTTSESRMNVQHIQNTRTATGTEEDIWTDTITPVADTAMTSIMGESAACTGSGNAYPRGFNTMYLLDASTVEHRRSDNGQTQRYAYCVVEWPSTYTSNPDNYEISLEYQWLTADFSQSNAEVFIDVDGRTGTEPLDVQYWAGSDWTSLGTITTAGPYNFTAVGLVGLTYTIRLVGTIETSDTIPDTWDIDLITLHSWTEPESNDFEGLSGIPDSWTGDIIWYATGDGDRYAEIDASEGQAEAMWNIDDIDATGQSVFLRWRYNTSLTPTDTTYQLIITHDGINSTINMLTGITKPSGASQWFVMCFDIEDLLQGIENLEAIGLRAADGSTGYNMIQLEYIGLRSFNAYAVDGRTLPDYWTGTSLQRSEIGFVTDATVIGFDNVDYHMTENTELYLGIVAKSGLTYSVEVYGMNAVQTIQPSENIVLSIEDGRNDIVLNLSDELTDITIITRVELRVSTPSQDSINFDYLALKDRSYMSLEQSADLWEVYLPDLYGIGIENSTGATGSISGEALTFAPLTTAPVQEMGLDLFIGYANYTMTGSAASTVAFLKDGLPESVEWSPNNVLSVYTDGRTMNLYVDTPLMQLNIGENETSVILDEVAILGYDSMRFEVMMIGWYNGTQIIRNYTVTNTGKVTWTTIYGTGQETLEGVRVWAYVDDSTPITPLSLMESDTEIVDRVNLQNVGTTSALTEGEYAIEMNRINTLDAEFKVDVDDFELISDRYLHLALMLDSGIDDFRIKVITTESDTYYANSFDGDSLWEDGEDYVADGSTTQEIWIDLFDQLYITLGEPVTNLSKTVDKILFSFGGSVSSAHLTIDDIFTSSVRASGLDDLRWQVREGIGWNWNGYLDQSDYSDTESISLVMGSAISGITMFDSGSALTLHYADSLATFEPHGMITLDGTMQTMSGELYTGTRVDSPEDYTGVPLAESATQDMWESDLLHYEVDLVTQGSVNMTVNYYDGTDTQLLDKSKQPMKVVVSTNNATGMDPASLPAGYYFLNLSADYRGSVFVSVSDILSTLDLSDGSTDFHNYEYFDTDPSWYESAYGGYTDWYYNGDPGYMYRISGEELRTHSGLIRSPIYDTTDAIEVEWSAYISASLETGDVVVKALADNGTYCELAVIETSIAATRISWTTTDPQFFHDGFAVRFEAYDIDNGEYCTIDTHDVRVRKTVEVDYPLRYDYTIGVTSGNVPTVRIITNPKVTPLVVYSTVDLAGSLLSEIYDGLTYDEEIFQPETEPTITDSYIDNWLASPTDIDVSSKGLKLMDVLGSWGMKRQIAGADEPNTARIETFIRPDIDVDEPLHPITGWGSNVLITMRMAFLSVIDQMSQKALDIGLERYYESGNEYYIVSVVQRSMYKNSTGVNIELKDFVMIPFADLDLTWARITVDLTTNTLKVETLDSGMQVVNTYTGSGFTSDVTRVHEISVQDSIPKMKDQYAFEADIDDIRVYANGYAVMREPFAAGDVNSLPGWERTTPGIYGMWIMDVASIDTSVETLYNINPIVLANYDSISAQMEFLNGWYRAGKYAESGTYSEYVSGYSETLDDEYEGSYYQHYHSVVDVGTTGLYTFEVMGDVTSEWKFYVDGVEALLDGNDQAQLYLRKGLHVLQIRAFMDSSLNIKNAFRLRVTRDYSPVTDMQAFVVEHGRYAVVYYDWEHAQRLGQGDSPSFYEGASTSLDNADVLMGASPILGMVVGMGSDHLARYMLRDILSARTIDGHTISPMVTTAGSVLFSSDTVPDTIFNGEDEGSLLETYLETFGYVATDGGKPFTLVTHSDGSTTEVSNGAELVMDLENNTFYVVDDHLETYSWRDAVDDSFYMKDDSTNAWDTSHGYLVPMDYNINDLGGIPLIFEFSTKSTGFSASYTTILGDDISIMTDPTHKTLLPPGDLIFNLYFEGQLPVGTSLYLTEGSLSGESVYDGTPKQFEQAIHKRTAICGDSTLTSEGVSFTTKYYPEFSGTVTKVSFAIDEYMERIISTSIFASNAEFKVTVSSMLNTLHLVGAEVHDTYNVQVGTGLNHAMVLPVSNTGYLHDLDFGVARPLADFEEVEPVSFDILNNDLSHSVLESMTAEPTMDAWPYRLETGDVSGLDRLLASTPFDEEEVSPQYYVDFSNQAEWRSVQVKYAWKHRDGGDDVTSPSSSNWAVQSWLSIGREAGATMPTDIGMMLPADLADFEPRVAIETQQLDALERRYIEYAGYGGDTTSLANPITLLADSNGGGVVSYGLSTSITYDHVTSNSSIVDAFLQMVASRNMLNLWGYSPKKESVINTRIGVSQWDEIQVMAQEGWIDRSHHGDADTLDQFVSYTYDDMNGADWYTGDSYSSTPQTYYFNETLELRQPTPELNSWDWAYNTLLPETVYRYPQVQANWVEFDINA